MKTLILQTSHRLLASLLRYHFSRVGLLEGITRFVAPVFLPAKRPDWKEVAQTPLTVSSPRAQSHSFAWRTWAAIVTFALQMAAGGAEPSVQWATVAGGPGPDAPYGIALALAGQLYLAGDFEQELNEN